MFEVSFGRKKSMSHHKSTSVFIVTAGVLLVL